MIPLNHMIIFKTFEEPEACMHALTHPETRGPGNAHAAENEVAGGVAAGPRVGVATRELQKRAAKGKRQRCFAQSEARWRLHTSFIV